MPSKTMFFQGVKVRASARGGLGPWGALLALVLAAFAASALARGAVMAAETIGPTIIMLLHVIPGVALAGMGAAVAWRIVERRRTERAERFVRAKLAAELAAELPAAPPRPVRVECTRELPAPPELPEEERIARGLAALEAAARRFPPKPVDLDKLRRRP